LHPLGSHSIALGLGNPFVFEAFKEDGFSWAGHHLKSSRHELLLVCLWPAAGSMDT
jgi:hypothetical protein